LLEAGDFVGLQKLPKTLHLFVYITDVKLQVDLEVIRQFGVSRVTFRELANNGLGVKKASW
jgi:small subunit ribosomal protein S14